MKVDLADKSATDSFGFKDTLVGHRSGARHVIKDKLSGDGKANELQGGDGADTLDGRGGSDLLAGGLGKDKLTGGDGGDFFRFDTASGPANFDTIVKFKSGADTIELDDAIFLAIGSKLNAAEFLARSSGHKAGDASDRIIYDKSDGSLWYDQDGNKKGP